MHTHLRHERGRISLVELDPSKPKNEQNVLAAMTLFEGTGCWQLVDVRLSRYAMPNPYAGGGSAEDFCASYVAQTPEAAELVRSLLRRYREEPEGDGVKFVWCTFEGIVPGNSSVNGYAPPTNCPDAGFLSRRAGLDYLRQAQVFWEAYTGGNFRVDNPHRQPRPTEIWFAVRQLENPLLRGVAPREPVPAVASAVQSSPQAAAPASADSGDPASPLKMRVR